MTDPTLQARGDAAYLREAAAYFPEGSGGGDAFEPALRVGFMSILIYWGIGILTSLLVTFLNSRVRRLRDLCRDREELCIVFWPLVPFAILLLWNETRPKNYAER